MDLIYIEELQSATSQELDQIRNLLKQLSPESDISSTDLDAILITDAIHVYVARLILDKRIVGISLLVILQILDRKKGMIEDFVVDGSCRRQGIGRQLLNHAISEARKYGVQAIDLTSNPERVAANKFYQDAGFEKRNTNVYRYTLGYDEA